MSFLQTDDAGVQHKGHDNGKGIGRDKGQLFQTEGCYKEVAYDAPGGGDDPAKEAVQGIVVSLGVEKDRKNAGKAGKGSKKPHTLWPHEVRKARDGKGDCYGCCHAQGDVPPLCNHGGWGMRVVRPRKAQAKTLEHHKRCKGCANGEGYVGENQHRGKVACKCGNKRRDP